MYCLYLLVVLFLIFTSQSNAFPHKGNEVTVTKYDGEKRNPDALDLSLSKYWTVLQGAGLSGDEFFSGIQRRTEQHEEAGVSGHKSESIRPVNFMSSLSSETTEVVPPTIDVAESERLERLRRKYQIVRQERVSGHSLGTVNEISELEDELISVELNFR